MVGVNHFHFPHDRAARRDYIQTAVRNAAFRCGPEADAAAVCARLCAGYWGEIRPGILFTMVAALTFEFPTVAQQTIMNYRVDPLQLDAVSELGLAVGAHFRALELEARKEARESASADKAAENER